MHNIFLILNLIVGLLVFLNKIRLIIMIVKGNPLEDVVSFGFRVVNMQY